ncbi:MAG: transketolase [Chloroflexi bacterium]|nr:transketolase [Chloroflexota bacterium]
MTTFPRLQSDAINTLRFLSADMVQQANSGHPGLPMGCAALAYTIWTQHLRHNPRNPSWPGRDRFILSGGHGCALLYSLLHLTGYGLPLEELKRFRQWGSMTPGHPEYGHTPGVEATTGPLGQGFSNGVGMAIAEAHLAAEFNTSEHKIFDHFIYAIVTDGDLMEGITAEAASLAGHLKLGRLVYLYDDNRISIDGSTDIAFTEDRAARFAAYGWHIQHVDDGNDVEVIDKAIATAKSDPRPSLVVCRTTIGYGLPTRQGTSKAHGEPPGDVELNAAKEKLDWPVEPRFHIPEEVLQHFRQAEEKGREAEAGWKSLLETYRAEYPDKAAELARRLRGELPAGWELSLPEFPADEKGTATRIASGKVLNALAAKIPELLGGSADLAPSNKTWLDRLLPFQAATPEGRNFHFGVREHAMGAVVNGMAVYGGLIPYGATFLTFADYMRTPLRLSALSGYPSIWVFTHDSIGLGEDGPTHQPVEHLATLRAIPELVVLRPADANETAVAWKVAIERRAGPTVLALTRQDVPTLDRSLYAPAEGLERGAYVLADLGEGDPALILMASGSEVQLALEAGLRLAAEAVSVRVVSFPSWELFAAQTQDYRDSILPSFVKARLAVEAGVTQGWERWVGGYGSALGIDRYGASAPYQTIYKEYGLTTEAVIRKALDVLRNCA